MVSFSSAFTYCYERTYKLYCCAAAERQQRTESKTVQKWESWDLALGFPFFVTKNSRDWKSKETTPFPVNLEMTFFMDCIFDDMDIVKN